ncbi:M48 family metallopeptidase [Rugamonas sp.]|uniref:M48 family metallopeptidase n=1 Tax=Rugamonas sp. TaxID=1926287 RepID=UPI0025F89894|nr:M48 family metallopeptidase [Rugamonas sp.]
MAQPGSPPGSAADTDPAAGLAPVAAFYFDGKTSRRHAVRLRVRGGDAVVTSADVDADGGRDADGGAIERRCPLAQLRVSERSVHAARKVSFPDGAFLEIADRAAFAALLAATGHADSWVVRQQQSWRGALTAAAATVAALVLGYLFLLPPAAALLARALPLAVERKFGDGMLDILDRHVFAPSALPAARQRQLIADFGRLLPPVPHPPPYHIVFRKSRIGPNAFSLPSGDIVMTDEMVALMPDDAALMGILAHELGHLHERHLMRRIIQSSAVAASATLLFGDVSSAIAALPPLLLDLKYSRDIEREADDYAIAMLLKNGIAPEHLAQVFVRLDRFAGAAPAYLSSHPSSPERIARIRAAARPQRATER